MSLSDRLAESNSDDVADYSIILLSRLASMSDQQWQPARQPMNDHRQPAGPPRSGTTGPSQDAAAIGQGGLNNPLEGGIPQPPQDCPPTYASAVNDWPSVGQTIHINNGVGRVINTDFQEQVSPSLFPQGQSLFEQMPRYQEPIRPPLTLPPTPNPRPPRENRTPSMTFWGITDGTDVNEVGNAGIAFSFSGLGGQFQISKVENFAHSINTPPNLRKSTTSYTVSNVGQCQFQVSTFGNANTNMSSKKPVVIDNEARRAAHSRDADSQPESHEEVQSQARRDEERKEPNSFLRQAVEWPAVLATTTSQYIAHVAVIALLLLFIPCLQASPTTKFSLSSVRLHDEKPVIFEHRGSAYTAPIVAGIRRDINIRLILQFIVKVESLCLTLEEGEAFKTFANHSAIRSHVQSILNYRLSVLQMKQAELADNFQLATDWLPKVASKINSSKSLVPNPFKKGVHGMKGLSVDRFGNLPDFSGNRTFDFSRLVHRNSSGTRGKREISLNINRIFSDFLDDVLSIFNQASIRQVKSSVRHLAADVQNSFHKFEGLYKNMASALSTLQEDNYHFRHYSSVLDIIMLTLGMAENQLDLVLRNMDDLVMGRLSSFLMNPLQCLQAFNNLTTYAATLGMEPIIGRALDILTLPASSFTTSDGFTIIIHAPLVVERDRFDVFRVASLPFAANGSTYVTKLSDDIFAIRRGLFPAEHMTMTYREFDSRCTHYGSRAICDVVVKKTPSCLLALFQKEKHFCPLLRLKEREKVSFKPILLERRALFYFAEPTRVMVRCHDYQASTFEVGLKSFPHNAGCSVATNDYTTYHRHSQDGEVLSIHSPSYQNPYRINSSILARQDAIEDADPVGFDDFVDTFPNSENSSYIAQWDGDAIRDKNWYNGTMATVSFFIVVLLLVYCLRHAFCAAIVREAEEDLSNVFSEKEEGTRKLSRG